MSENEQKFIETITKQCDSWISYIETNDFDSSCDLTNNIIKLRQYASDSIVDYNLLCDIVFYDMNITWKLYLIYNTTTGNYEYGANKDYICLRNTDLSNVIEQVLMDKQMCGKNFKHYTVFTLKTPNKNEYQITAFTEDDSQLWYGTDIYKTKNHTENRKFIKSLNLVELIKSIFIIDQTSE